VDSAHDDIEQSGSWDALLSAEEFEFLSSSISAERLGDLRCVLEECPSEIRGSVVAEIRTASGFGDRAILLALARVTHAADAKRAPS
jgi:hypothetical protein